MKESPELVFALVMVVMPSLAAVVVWLIAHRWCNNQDKCHRERCDKGEHEYMHFEDWEERRRRLVCRHCSHVEKVPMNCLFVDRDDRWE